MTVTLRSHDGRFWVDTGAGEIELRGTLSASTESPVQHEDPFVLHFEAIPGMESACLDSAHRVMRLVDPGSGALRLQMSLTITWPPPATRPA